jgi:hypothetical protein
VKRAPLVGLCAITLGIAACTRVVDAVTDPGVGTVCTPQSTDLDCMPTPWPTGDHTANSDPWLVTHNQVITVMKPTVLVLNFDTGRNSTETKAYAQQVADALAAGSMYHGYSDATATPFLIYQIAPVVDLTTVSPPTASGSPLTLDPTALFTDPKFPPLYGYPDSNGGYLSLCDLFEQGKVNEVWIQDGGDAQVTPRAPLYAEQKQKYGDDGAAISGAFVHEVGGFSGGQEEVFSLNVPCKVTVRLAHLDPSGSGGPACDVEVRGWGIEGMWAALPSSLAVDAYAFLNQDFNTRFGLDFAGWPQLCPSAASCVSYPNPTEATSTTNDSTSFDIKSFMQGCGSSLFPPNATSRYDFENGTMVYSRCAGFGLGGGPNGGDQYAPYYADSVISGYDQMYSGTSACRAGWQIYWRQSMPGYQNKATATDKTPMKNWWPVLFY